MSDEDDASLISVADATGDTPPPSGDTPPSSGDTPPPSGDTPKPAAFSMYGENGLNAELTKMLGEGDDMKGARSVFKKFAGADNPTEAFLKNLNDLQYHASQKSFVRPPDDAPDATKEAFEKQVQQVMGTPDTWEGYKYTDPASFPDGMELDTARGEAIAKLLHEHHASPALAKALLEADTAEREGIPDQIVEQERAHKKEQFDILREEHGVNAEKVVNTATEVGRLLGASPTLISQIALTAEGATWLAGVKNLISSDIMSTIGKGEGVTGGAGVDWLAKGMESARLATEALKKNDNTAYEKHNVDANAYRKRGSQ